MTIPERFGGTEYGRSLLSDVVGSFVLVVVGVGRWWAGGLRTWGGVCGGCEEGVCVGPRGFGGLYTSISKLSITGLQGKKMVI